MEATRVVHAIVYTKECGETYVKEAYESLAHALAAIEVINGSDSEDHARIVLCPFISDAPNITQSRLDELEERDTWLNALECAGLDNWSGIDFAHETLEEWKKEDG